MSKNAAAVVAVLAIVLGTVAGAPLPAGAHEGHTGAPYRRSSAAAPAGFGDVLADFRLAQAGPDPAGPDIGPTPKAECGPGSNPETGTQGRVPQSEIDSGRAAQGYTCNTAMLAHVGSSGGYKVERYVDKAGHECAFYDTTLLFPANAANLSSGELTGVAVLDMKDPSNPVVTANLLTPAMQSPHESMSLNHKRGLLAAASANPVFYPGVVDIYDVSEDCLHPTLKASAPVGGLGHESGWAPDGNTFYVAALHAPVVTAIDVTNPSVPVVLGVYPHLSHGISVSDDGNRLYMATYSNASNNDAERGLAIFDVSEIQSRKLNPQMKEVSRLTWATVSTPQINLPVTIGGTPYLIEMDEFGGGDKVGAARIIDITDDTKPRVVSNLRLEVNQKEHQDGPQLADAGADSGLQGYDGHYCNVPQRVDPGIVACTFILSGLRVFDIRDPLNPREIAYFNGPIDGSAYAMSSPAFVPDRGEIWYSDGNSGFYVVKLTNGVWPFTSALGPAATAAGAVGSAGAAAAAPGAAATRAPAGQLPATGAVLSGLVGVAALIGALGLRRAVSSPTIAGARGRGRSARATRRARRRSR